MGDPQLHWRPESNTVTAPATQGIADLVRTARRAVRTYARIGSSASHRTDGLTTGRPDSRAPSYDTGKR
ncbi:MULTISPECIES: hypothetical protein [Rhodococcus]|uniref:Uncharacterized protein n=1 Tax=Rhodococcus opacus RKJ300 = JCM 13270 TaxID=1165867 RepID=I0WUD3_RHOOP|nr:MULTISPECIES: hypothetical protein [Rhodococcus]EID79999.1 hypothetical protein W59_10399 [Rhodococcus opacus RKJ300 = JCM 13270]QQZ18189.1 hypothetical protein GO592_38605 [Rhodococcus sp. 21391]UOT08105.1 hypothetical protein MPY17_37700 [Rhodococcus opacus]